MRTIRLGPDARTRKRYFVEASFQHPAKMHCGIISEIGARYDLKSGDWVLDPMAGSGTTMLLARQGINACLLELEEHFIEPMRASWEKMRQHPMLGYEMGKVLILRCDARALPIASADAIVTSPPYEGTEIAQSSDGEANRRFRAGEYTGDAVKGMGLNRGYTRPAGGDNIGNLRNEAYWTAMRRVYEECYRVLRPGGLMALVLKGYTRDGQYVDLPGLTTEMLQSMGWLLHEHWRRELWSLSFWRILQRRRDPAAFDDRLNYEEVLCFRKPEQTRAAVAGATDFLGCG